MNAQESIIRKTETAFNDLADLWRRRKWLCVVVLIIIAVPICWALIGIPHLQQELRSRTQERDKLEVQLAPFLAVANKSFPNIPADKRLGALQEKLDSIQHSVGLLRKQIELIVDRSSIIPTLYELLKDGENKTSSENEWALRKDAYAKYKDKDFTAALVAVSKALSAKPDSAKAHLLQAYIYSDLYRDFAPAWPRGLDEKAKAEIADIWYREGVASFRTAAQLAESTNVAVRVDALARQALLHAEKGLKINGAEADRMFQKALQGMADLKTRFPTNEQVNLYRDLVKRLYRLSLDPGIDIIVHLESEPTKESSVQ